MNEWLTPLLAEGPLPMDKLFQSEREAVGSICRRSRQEGPMGRAVRVQSCFQTCNEPIFVGSALKAHLKDNQVILLDEGRLEEASSPLIDQVPEADGDGIRLGHATDQQALLFKAFLRCEFELAASQPVELLFVELQLLHQILTFATLQ